MFARFLVWFGLVVVVLDVGAGVIIPRDGSWRYFKGLSEASTPDRTAWRLPGFADGGWLTGNAAFYFENQPGSANAFTGNTSLDMFGNYTCVFLRRTFVLNSPYDYTELQLSAFSDDGFIAWINGQEVARFNMPDGDIAFSSNSLPALSEPLSWVTNIISNPRDILQEGTNVLCIQAFNVNKSSSSDFIINAGLSGTEDATGPALIMIHPPVDTTIRQLTTIEVAFDEPVAGLDASDLLINGQPAGSVSPVSAAQYVFSLAAVPAGPVQVAWAAGNGIRDLSGNSNAFTGVGWGYTVNPSAPADEVVISEFLCSNSGEAANSVTDELGTPVDWIELHNRTAAPVSLTGWYLTDNASRLTKWQFPPTILEAGGYLVVFASDRETNVAGQLHTNFKLSTSPGYLALVNPAGEVVSAFTPLYPQQYTDISYGRDRSDSSICGYFTNSTPGEANASGGQGFGPEVRFSRASGTFIDPFTLSLTTADTNCDIRYVLVTANVPSGSEPLTNVPTASSLLYTNPITIIGPVQVRARAFPRQTGILPGPPRTESYLRITAPTAAFTSDLPVILLHNLGGGTVPQSVDQNVVFMVFEPVQGRTSLTNPPTLVSRAGFNVRGSSTAGLPQASFALEFWDEFNEDRDLELLGMPAESDWVLFGQNRYDNSLLHNPLMHRLSRDIGRYSSRTRFAEVFLNTTGGLFNFAAPAGGHYYGLYTVEEKVKRSQNRVDIEKLEAPVTTAPTVTGGYLLKIDRQDADERSFYNGYAQQTILFQDPPGLEMVDPARSAQYDYITGYFSQFGAALWGVNYTNPTTGYAAYIDVPSWIDHHLLNALAFNADAFRLSGFFFKDREKKLEMGPLWDFDRSQGSYNPSYGGDARTYNPRVWRLQLSGDQGTDFFGNPNLLGVRWWQRLFGDVDFWQKWIDRWGELRRDGLSTNQIFGVIDELAGQINQAQARQNVRWQESRPRSGNLVINGYSYLFNGTYQGEINFLKKWFTDRVDFIDTNFLRAPVFSRAGGAITQGTTLTITGPTKPAGSTVYYTLDGTDPRLPGGGILPAARSGTGPITLTLTNNVRVFARARNLAHSNVTNWVGSVGGNPPISTPWSAMMAITYVVNTPSLVISEIMYHPADPASGAYSDDDFEFIELKNVGTQALSLPGFTFTEGIEFTFNSTNSVTTLAPGGYCVLVRNRTAFLTRYPGITNIAGQFGGSLDNAGERLVLRGPLEEPILDFSYKDSWIPTSDGLGFSLVVLNESAPTATWGDKASWRAGSVLQGTPGRADPAPPAFPRVVVSEALTHTDLPQVDAIELINIGSTPAEIGGWFLTDDASEPMKYTIAPRTLAPGEVVVFTADDFDNGSAGSFGLSSLGEEVYVFSGTGTNITGYRHGFEFGAQFNGAAFGRHVTSEGKEHFVSVTPNTLGNTNSGPSVGPVVINEVMFAPPAFGSNANNLQEYVELRNVSAGPVPLFDPANPENTWRFDEGISFSFPAGVTLDPAEIVLVVSFDPEFDPVATAWFRAAFGLSSAVRLFGPWSGNLSNQGESIGLYWPDVPEPASDPNAGFVPYVLLEEVDYETWAPWPATAVETGNSLARVNGTTFGDEPTNWVAAAPSPGRINPGAVVLDVDSDGLPDDWEIAYGLDPGEAQGAQGRDGDLDGDAASNWHEYVSATDPSNPADYLRFTSISVVGSECRLEFESRAGRLYALESTIELFPGGLWVPVLENIPGDGTSKVLTQPSPGGTPTFYRLRVVQAP